VNVLAHHLRSGEVVEEVGEYLHPTVLGLQYLTSANPLSIAPLARLVIGSEYSTSPGVNDLRILLNMDFAQPRNSRGCLASCLSPINNTVLWKVMFDGFNWLADK
jgi:hypothetical protein